MLCKQERFKKAFSATEASKSAGVFNLGSKQQSASQTARIIFFAITDLINMGLKSTELVPFISGCSLENRNMFLNIFTWQAIILHRQVMAQPRILIRPTTRSVCRCGCSARTQLFP